jgi:hypothetical protein
MPSLRGVTLVLVALLALVLPAVPSAFATAHSCGDVWCNGNDGATRYNTSGNEPQFYGGEIGVYYLDFGTGGTEPCPSDPGNVCFNVDAANAAKTKYQSGTGIGTQYYYILGGPSSARKPSGISNYCWGWRQGGAAFSDMSQYFGPWNNWAVLVFGDIEGEQHLGWNYSTPGANDDVLD